MKNRPVTVIAIKVDSSSFFLKYDQSESIKVYHCFCSLFIIPIEISRFEIIVVEKVSEILGH